MEILRQISNIIGSLAQEIGMYIPFLLTDQVVFYYPEKKSYKWLRDLSKNYQVISTFLDYAMYINMEDDRVQKMDYLVDVISDILINNDATISYVAINMLDNDSLIRKFSLYPLEKFKKILNGFFEEELEGVIRKEKINLSIKVP